MYRAVLFDFGHTLFDSLDPAEHARAFSAATGTAVDAAALADTWAEIRRRSFLAEEIAKQRDLSPERHRECWLALLAPLDDLAPGLAAHVYAGESSAVGWTPYVDSMPVLSTLSDRGVRIGVVSDTGWDIRPVFVKHGLDEFIDVYVLSYEHGAVKPAPKLFHHACDELGVPYAETVMVGDNHLTDGGAAAAGCSALILPHVAGGQPRGLDAVVKLLET
jgi:FMN phosphatase YigB (HAD superfamily)